MKQKVYPSWRYHKSLEAKIVRSAAEDVSLGDGWVESPADVDIVEPVPLDLSTEPIEVLVKMLVDGGVTAKSLKNKTKEQLIALIKGG